MACPSSWHWRWKKKEQIRVCILWKENGEEGARKKRIAWSIKETEQAAAGKASVEMWKRREEEK